MDAERRIGSDDGIGLVEIVVAMFVLTTLALSFLPLLVAGLKLSATTSTLAVASRLADKDIALARGTSTCHDLQMFVATAPSPASVPDGRGGTIVPHRILVSCPATYPGTARFREQVTGSSGLLVDATTLIYMVTS